MANFGIFRGFSEKLFEGELPTNLGLIGSIILPTFLLDSFPNSSYAYSLRRLRGAYTGSAIRVRRSSDNAEQDIGFTALGELDTSSLLSHCGSGNGFVTTWYDQSGNGRNATQSTAANQPQIVDTGSVYQLNGKPTIIAAPTKYFALSNLSTNLYSLFITYYKTATGNQAVIGGGDGKYMWLDYNLNQYIATNTIITISSGFATNTPYIYNVIGQSSSGAEIWRNNVSLGTTGAYSSNDVTGNLPFADFRTASIYLQEMIIYYSNQSLNRTGISTNINTYYGIY